MALLDSVTPQQKLAGNLALAIGTSVWATHFLVTGELLENWDPYFITAGRLLSATLFLMTAFVIQSGGRPFRGLRWGPALLLGSVGIAGSTVCLTLGVKYAGAVPAAIVAASSPILAAFVARLGFRMPLTLAVILGAIVAACGGVFAAIGNMEGGIAALLAGNTDGIANLRGGEFLILLALTIFTWYSIGAQRWMTGSSQLGITAITIMIGGLTMLAAIPLLVLSGVAQPEYSLDWRSIGFIFYLGAGPASFALFTWHWGVSRVGVTIASIYSNLVPVVVVAIRMIEGEPPTTEHLIGGVLIICGVLIAQLLPTRNLPETKLRKPA